MTYKLGDVMISREKIAARVKELAAEIAKDYKKDNNVTLGILTGAAVFLTDLIREMPEDMDVKMDFMSIASYGEGTTSSGVVRIYHDLKKSIEGKHIIVVEDIVDTGLTLSHLLGILQSESCESESLRTARQIRTPKN